MLADSACRFFFFLDWVILPFCLRLFLLLKYWWQFFFINIHHTCTRLCALFLPFALSKISQTAIFRSESNHTESNRWNDRNWKYTSKFKLILYFNSCHVMPSLNRRQFFELLSTLLGLPYGERTLAILDTDWPSFYIPLEGWYESRALLLWSQFLHTCSRYVVLFGPTVKVVTMISLSSHSNKYIETVLFDRTSVLWGGWNVWLTVLSG